MWSIILCLNTIEVSVSNINAFAYRFITCIVNCVLCVLFAMVQLCTLCFWPIWRWLNWVLSKLDRFLSSRNKYFEHNWGTGLKELCSNFFMEQNDLSYLRQLWQSLPFCIKNNIAYRYLVIITKKTVVPFLGINHYLFIFSKTKTLHTALSLGFFLINCNLIKCFQLFFFSLTCSKNNRKILAIDGFDHSNNKFCTNKPFFDSRN